MRLIALQKFTYGNAVLEVGDEFESSSDEDARLLKGFGKAEDAKPKRGRGRYNRADMRAED